MILKGDHLLNPKPVSKDRVFVEMHLDWAIAQGTSALEVVLWGLGNLIVGHKCTLQISLVTGALR
jgi:hypothetical protein